MMVFKPAGFNISAPVYECIGDEYKQILAQEVKLDLSNGFFGKTIIHPWQIDVVQAMYQVSVTELDIAKKLLSPHSAAVFFPQFLNKRYAVEYLISKHQPELTIGMGDSRTDLGFINCCDFQVFPKQSDIANHVHGSSKS